MEPIIRIENYSFAYASSNRKVLKEIDLKFYPGEITILAGPTGCGKSTLLKSLIGLIPHMYAGSWSGRIIVDGATVHQSRISDLARRVGYVFQNPENQIFMFSVERDIAFGLENLGMARGEIRERVDWAMALLGITELATKPPHELSDGQKQRTALAGVLAMKPVVLIMDEPTSLLDPRTALDLINLLLKLRDELGITMIIVEHRLDLVARIADRLLVMREGRAVADGRPKEIFHSDHSSLADISIPTVTRLHRALAMRGAPLDGPVISVEEAIETIRRRRT